MRVLVYGDSNSWGTLADGSGVRHPRRWPIVLSERLGDAVEVVEDCLPGRTTVHDDPEMGGRTFNGLAHFEASLLAHAPLDLVLIMLGTNDFKARFSPNARKIAANLGKLVETATTIGAGSGPWREAAAPQVALIVPPPLPDHVEDPNWERVDEWTGGRAASRDLLQAVRDRCEGVPVLDAHPHAVGSLRDPIHFEAESHEALGRAVADWIVAAVGSSGK